MKGFIVNCDLYVEDDDADGALATAQTILEDAHGTDSPSVDARDDYTTFGYALGGVREREPLDAIRNVVNYNWSDELADYLAQGDAPSHHIFRDLQQIVSWLDSRTVS